MLVAEWAYEDIDVSYYLDRLDYFAASALRECRGMSAESFGEIRALNRILFRELGFRGNEEDYYDPQNSFLHKVIERRTGIPISLSVLYIEVARRMNVQIDGVSFPGHFLVRYDRDDGSVIIDPYRMGLTLDVDDLERMLKRAAGPDAELSGEMLAPASKRDILLRMLTNLAQLYRKRGDVSGSIEVLERMRVLSPDNSRIEQELSRLRVRAAEVN